VLKEGTPAPDFTVPDQDGDPVSLSDFRGSWLVLWWFPKAFTSG
jgi:peroxiredoxin Q/BCP